MLLDPKTQRGPILASTVGFLNTYEKGTAEGSVDKLHPEMLSAFGSFRCICSAIVAVLHPEPNHANSSAQDFQSVVSYDGDELCMESLRDTFMAEKMRC